MKVRLGRDARRELRWAMTHYEEQRAGPGQEFFDAISNTLPQIGEWPSAGRPFADGLRGSIVHGFPYWLLYRQRNSSITVMGVAHQKRGEDYWRSRGRVREPSADYWPLVA